MRLSVAVPGQIQHPGAQAYTRDLYDRIGRIVSVERRPVREARRGKGGYDASAQSKEGEALRAALPEGHTAVALDLSGKLYSSDAFLTWLVQQAESGSRGLCFVIGGPDGLDDATRAVCRERLCLSPMTLPHELAEVVLLEQLYRALTRWKGLPYHR
jgi:23S rRNA (pseudouridine1915-N3)-methyltransferase